MFLSSFYNTGMVELNSLCFHSMINAADEIMSQKDHGTSSKPVQSDLRYGVDRKLGELLNYIVLGCKMLFLNLHFPYLQPTKYAASIDTLQRWAVVSKALRLRRTFEVLRDLLHFMTQFRECHFSRHQLNVLLMISLLRAKFMGKSYYISCSSDTLYRTFCISDTQIFTHILLFHKTLHEDGHHFEIKKSSGIMCEF